jgi:hypothetical protein
MGEKEVGGGGRWGGGRELREECVLLCFIKPILGNRYGPGVIS